MRRPHLPYALLLLACAGETASDALPVWTLEEDLRIGSLDEAATSLTMVTSIEVGPDGRVYVAQPLDRQIRVFDANGAPAGVIGRPGEGPGEFQSVMALGWRADSLWVADGQARRTSFFDPEGAFLGDVTWLNVKTPREELLPAVPGILLDDGTAILQFRSFSDAVTSGAVKARPWVRVDRRGEMLDSVWDAPVGGNQLTIAYEGGALFTVQPWRTDPFLVPAGSGDPLYIVDPMSGAGAFVRATRIDTHGDTAWVRDVPSTAIPITAERRDSARDTLVARLESFRERRGASVGELRGWVDEAMRIPPVVPPVVRGTVASDGALWLERADRPGTWTVVNGDGDVLADVRVPDGVRLLRVDGDAVYGTVTDEFDVPYVVRLHIRRDHS